MAHNLVVPKIHVQRQFIIHAFHIECGHVADDALQRAVDLDFRKQQVREYSIRVSRFLVLVMLRFALDSGKLAAFVRIGIGEDKSRVQAEFGVEPSVAMGRIFLMVLLEQENVVHEVLRSFREVGELFLPAVEAASLNAHDAAKRLDRELSGKLQDYLVFLLTYRMTEPSPFTS